VEAPDTHSPEYCKLVVRPGVRLEYFVLASIRMRIAVAHTTFMDEN